MISSRQQANLMSIAICGVAIAAILTFLMRRAVIIGSSVSGELTLSLMPVTSYNAAILSYNYWNVGFSRRGLQGTIFHVFDGGDPSVAAVWYFFACALLALMPIMLLTWRLLTVDGRIGAWLLLVLVVSPQTFLGWSNDVGRSDLLIVAAIAWSCVAAAAGRPLTAATMLLIGSLAHEMALIYGVPVSLILLARSSSYARRRYLVRFAGLTVIGYALILTTYRFFGPSNTELFNTILRLHPGERYSAFLTTSGLRNIVDSQCQSFLYTGTPAVIMLSIITVFLYFPVLLMSGRRQLIDFTTVTILPFVVSCVLAIDYGRWTMFSVVNGWLFAVVVYILGQAGPVARPRSAFIAMAALLVLIVQRPALLGFPSGFAYRYVTARWGTPPLVIETLDACDPAWRTFKP